MAASWEAGDREAVRHRAHALSSAAGNLGFMRLAGVLTALESLCRAGTSAIGDALRRVDDEAREFKAVNDTIGHAGGDEMLRKVGAALRSATQNVDTAARLGGDEFAIIQKSANHPSDAVALAERVIAAIATCCDDSSTEIGVSIGIATSTKGASTPDELLAQSDMALDRAKHDGKGGYRFFEIEMDARMRERRTLERDLKAAILAEELDVYYQPQANAATGDIVGFEALVRWRHPKRGMISPAEFIPLAEECGLIRAIGEWVLRRACRQAADWAPTIRIGVNLSPLQVRHDLPQLVRRVLAETGLSANRLELEITEGVLIKETVQTVAVLKELKTMGIAIALDDFGTGYSSLSYLQKFPFDRVKIDRSFVTELLRLPEADAIIRAVVAMTRSLCIASIAEGVETAQQLNALQRESCEEVQGFLIGRPMPGADVAGFLTNRMSLGSPLAA